MITLAELTEFLGWVSIINIAYLVLATLIMVLAKDAIACVHNKLLKIDSNGLDKKYFDFLSQYKVATMIFSVAPYIALKLMSQ